MRKKDWHATDEQSLVLAQLSSSSKQAIVCSYILPVCIVELTWSHGMLLLSVQIHSYLIQTEILEMERIMFQMTVECLIADQSDHDACGQLSGE